MKRIVSFILCLILVFLVTACTNETANPITDEEPNGEISEEPNAEQELEEDTEGEPEKETVSNDPIRDTQAVIEFVHSTDQNVDNFVIDENHTAYYFDITGDGTDEVCFVNDEWSAVVFVTDDFSDGYDIIYSYIYADKSFEFYEEEGFIIADNKYEYVGTKGQILSIYYYDGADGIMSVSDYSLIIKDECLENPIFNTYILSEGTITKNDGLKDFIYNYADYYIDERGDKHLFTKYSRNFKFNEENLYFETTENDESVALSISELRKKIGYYGTDDSLKTFNEMYSKGDMLTAINYYYENRYDFTKGAKEEYANSICNSIQEILLASGGDMYSPFEYCEETTIDNGIEITVECETELIPEKEKSVFEVVKTYYAMEGSVDEMGYSIAVTDKDISKMIYAAILDLPQDDMGFYFDDILTDIEFTNIDEVINYPQAYPNVTIGSLDDLEKLKHEGTWKTTIMLPVKVKYSN